MTSQPDPSAAEAATESVITQLGRLPPDAEGWVRLLTTVGTAVVGGLVLHVLVFFVLRRLARRSEEPTAGVVARQMRWPALLGLVILPVKLALPRIQDQLGGELPVVNQTLSIGVIITLTWLAIAAVECIEQVIHVRYRIDVEDNLQQRKIQTQTRVLVRAIQVLVVVFGAAAVLMTFDGIRQFGASLLASAGLAGLVIGLAAKPVVANLIAGVQIALTQPIRIDDVVIVEGEWGRIEEITTTYVVVKIWDERRLIVPLSYFIEHPFQNWTRTSAELLGTVFLFVDYSVPLGELRGELERFVESRAEWDKRVCQIVVTDATEKTLQIRALVSARSSGKLWDLRCAVREHLLSYVQREFPGALPRLRAALDQPPLEREG